jgi:hypothetical protein
MASATNETVVVDRRGQRPAAAGGEARAKVTFYQMLGVERGVEIPGIDAAYARATARLTSNKQLQGTAEAAREMAILEEGYRILSTPARRAKYDAMLIEADTGVKLMLDADDAPAKSKLIVAVCVLLALAAGIAGAMFMAMERKIDDVQLAHKQEVQRRIEEREKSIVIDTTKDGAAPKVHKVIIKN